MSKRSRKSRSSSETEPISPAGGGGKTAVAEPKRDRRRSRPEAAGVDWNGIIASVVVVLVVVTAIYGHIVGYRFVTWDDDAHVYANPHLTVGDSPDVGYFWSNPYKNLYIPATYTLWSMVASSARVPVTRTGMPPFDPSAFHVTSIVLHAINCLLVLALLRLLLRRGRFADRIPENAVTPAALIGALAFATHPLQVESVAWISETKGLLCTAFSLTALYCYVRYASAEPTPRGRRGPSTSENPWLWFATASTAFVLALLSKPNAATLPLVALAIDYWWIGRPIAKSVYLGAWLFASLLLFLKMGSVQPVTSTDTLIPPLWKRPLIAGDALAFYLWKLALPVHLNFDYGRTPNVVLAHSWVYATFLVPIVLALIAWRGPAALKVAYGIFVAVLLPVLGLAPFIYQVYSTVADRYAYFAVFGLALLLAYIAARRPHPAVWGICGVLIVAWGTLAYLQTANWKDSIALYRHGIAENPRSWGAYGNLAKEEMTQADIDTAEHNVDAAKRDIDAAESDYRKAIALEEARPKPLKARPEAYNGLGAILADDRNRPADALPYYDKALAILPGYPEAHLQKAEALEMLGRNDEAVAEATEATRERPTYAEAHYVLGAFYGMHGDAVDAHTQFQRAVDLEPDNQMFQKALAGQSTTGP